MELHYTSGHEVSWMLRFNLYMRGGWEGGEVGGDGGLKLVRVGCVGLGV